MGIGRTGGGADSVSAQPDWRSGTDSKHPIDRGAHPFACAATVVAFISHGSEYIVLVSIF